MTYMREEFYIDYFNKKYLDHHFSDRKNVPHFGLAYKCFLGSDGYNHISNARNFSSLTLSILKYLKKPSSVEYIYKVQITENAFLEIGKTGKRVLEEILALHNDFVTPRRSHKKIEE